jgi:N-methylhydantoinase A
MPPGGTLRGPALLVEDHTTLVIPPGMTARCDEEGFIILRSEGDAS